MSAVCLVAPCGFGKTERAVEVAAIHAEAGRSVLYVVPTRALLMEIAERFRRLGVHPRIAVGRSTSKAPVNCRNPEADAAQAVGISLEAFCRSCPFFSECDYIAARAAIFPPGTVTLATAAFLLWNPVPLSRVDVVIYDEMPEPVVEIPADPRVSPPRSERARYIPLRSLPPAIRKAVRAYARRRGVPEPAGYMIPLLPRGTQETLILTATPLPGVLDVLLGLRPGELEYQAMSGEDLLALDQTVEWFYQRLPHSREWTPSRRGCGFKKNTAPGLPYFRASLGLSGWRGQALEAYGSFSPPLHVFYVLAYATGARLRLDPVDALFDEASFHEDPLEVLRARRIPGWTLSFVYETPQGERVYPVEWLTRAGDLSQLLGRGGILDKKASRAVGGIPLAARNHVWSYRLARRVRLTGYDVEDVSYAVAVHAFAFEKDPIGWMAAFWPRALRVAASSRLLDIARRTARRLKDATKRVNDTLSGKIPLEPSPDGGDHGWQEGLEEAEDLAEI
jgi:hypothetical protein